MQKNIGNTKMYLKGIGVNINKIFILSNLFK